MSVKLMDSKVTWDHFFFTLVGFSPHDLPEPCSYSVNIPSQFFGKQQLSIPEVFFSISRAAMREGTS